MDAWLLLISLEKVCILSLVLISGFVFVSVFLSMSTPFLSLCLPMSTTAIPSCFGRNTEEEEEDKKAGTAVFPKLKLNTTNERKNKLYK